MGRDWDAFLSQCPTDLRRDLQKRDLKTDRLPLFPENVDLESPESNRVNSNSNLATDLESAMDEALAAGDPKAFVEILGRIARKTGMSQVAQETGLAREALYRALSANGNPEFATVLKVTRALGLRLSAGKESAA